MSTCFYDNSGIMNGVDSHTYLTIGPEGIPLPVIMTPHGAHTAFMGPAHDASKRTATVLAEGWKMIKIGFSNKLVVHVPWTFLPPHPAEAIEIATIIALSSSTALLGVASVTGEGGALATCAGDCVGINANCGPGFGLVVNPSSVITSPTAGDFADAAAEWAFNIILGEVAGKLLPKSVKDRVAKAILKKIIGKFLKKAVMAVSSAAGGT